MRLESLQALCHGTWKRSHPQGPEILECEEGARRTFSWAQVSSALES